MKKNQKVKGSLTVEAALVVPIFLFFILIFLYFFQISYLHLKINSAMTQVALYCSKQAYLTNELVSDHGIDEVVKEKEAIVFLADQINLPKEVSGSYFKILVEEYLHLSEIENSIIVGGYSGLDIYQSEYLLDGETIDIILSYDCKLPITFFGIGELSFIQRIQTRGWIGVKGTPLFEEVEEIPEEKLELVYITETGKVYHRYENCTHLKLSITNVSFEEVFHLRNSNGGKYKPCKSCVDNIELQPTVSIYITTTGDRYHAIVQCSGLKRTITQVNQSNLPSGYYLCKRCQLRGDKGKDSR